MPGTVMSIASLGLVIASVSGFFPKPGLKAAVPCPGLMTQSQDASAVLSQDIRSANSVQSLESNQLVLTAPQGTVTYTFDAPGHSLTRTSAGLSRKLLTGVDSFSFSLLRRAGVEAPLGTLVPASAEDARAVTCRWSCSRNLAGARLDSEAFQMAPVVMRHR